MSETPMMNRNGNSLAAFKLYEAKVIPALLFNSESWIGITDTHISDIQISRTNLCENFSDCHLPHPKPSYTWTPDYS